MLCAQCAADSDRAGSGQQQLRLDSETDRPTGIRQLTVSASLYCDFVQWAALADRRTDREGERQKGKKNCGRETEAVCLSVREIDDRSG